MWEKQEVQDLANANEKVAVSQLPVLVRVLCRICLQLRKGRQQQVYEISN